jgi:hypothetical protein
MCISERLLGAACRDTALDAYGARARELAEQKADWQRNFTVLLDAYEKALRTEPEKPSSLAGER